MATTPDFRALIPTGSTARITRRALLSGFVVLGAAGALSACSPNKTFAASAKLDGVMENKLNIYSWGDYDDPGNITTFMKNGTTVQFDSYGSNEELIAKLGATRGTSGYDIIVPTGSYIPMMSQNGLLEELQLDQLKNFENIEPLYRNQSWDPGNKYSVCKNWGTTGYAYDARVITTPMESWADFLEAATGVASKKTALLEDSWEVCSIYFGAHGIDLNTTNKADLDACEEYMVKTLATHIKAFNSTAVTSGIPEETFVLMQAFNGDVRLGMQESDSPESWKFVYPTPTANIWMDTWAIAKGAQNLDAAYAFIDYMLEPEVSFREVDYMGYNTGVVGMADLAAANDFELPELVFPPDEVVARLTASEINSGTERIVKILNRMMAQAAS
ncbi:polyamine ABC transporter substrate-binding protein [Glaciibacter psychrotolerans]|uniref:Spermidine/putrescine transport system substrate-binding protein n=1 Tax=Glaciibacter psychrotolerans TaxID=670054 RepID=A0A7Z0J6Q8_9MICO|nr:spermidine/putrescine ABC transporter substrate-binding protein [Leifsonia psychrotolerans]NYJ20660.1 spermidine/putrescine transport system substrate-binding protein [Leifsonia psychrotolerans]